MYTLINLQAICKNMYTLINVLCTNMYTLINVLLYVEYVHSDKSTCCMYEYVHSYKRACYM